MLPTPVQNPFALLMNPDSVLQAVERSERLSRLHSRICRPLDKPVIGRNGKETGRTDARDDASEADDAGE
jgi:hypothetical protein